MEDEFIDEDQLIDDNIAENLHHTKTFEQYARPPIPSEVNNQNNDFIFMQIDVDYYITKVKDAEIAIIRMFGVTKDGNSVLAHVHDFEAYFYVEKPIELNTEPETLEELRKSLMVNIYILDNFIKVFL